jgi:hypothetical protein
LANLLKGKLSDTQKAVIESVISARNLLLIKLGVEKLPEKMEEVIRDIKTNGLPAAVNSIHFIFCENLPKLVSNLFELLPTAVRYDISPIEPKIKSANGYFTAPDPQTECVLAVSQIVELVDPQIVAQHEPDRLVENGGEHREAGEAFLRAHAALDEARVERVVLVGQPA